MPEKRFYPYSFENDALELLITEAAADPESISPMEYVDPDVHAMNLISAKGWSTIYLSCLVTDPNDRLHVLTDDGENIHDLVELYVICRSSSSRRRVAHQMKRAGEGKWEASFELERTEWADALSIEPIAVQAQAAENSSADVVHRRGTQIASGAPWAIYLDRKVVMPGGSIDGEWTSFREHPNPEVVKRADCGWYLDLQNMCAPRLLLNEDVQGFKSALSVTATHGRNAMIRNMVAQSFLQPVMLQLAFFSLDTLRETPLDEAEGWRKDLLIALARKAGHATSDVVVEMWLTAEGEEAMHRTRAEVATAAQRHLSTWTDVERAIRTIGDYQDG